MSIMDEITIDPSDERRIIDFRPLGIHGVVVLGRYQYASAHAPLPLHSHGPYFEISYAETGQQTYVVEDERFDLTGGDLFVTFPHEQHSTGSLPETKGVMFWMIVGELEPGERFLSLPPEEGAMILDRLRHLPARQFHGGKRIEQTLYKVFTAFDREDDPLRTVSVRNLLIRLLLDVLEASERIKPVVSPLIAELQRYIAENLEQPLTVSDLARQAGLSESRLKVRFRRETGFSPVDYVTRMKIDAARSLLVDKKLSVTTAAMQLGFSTSQYFATVFKRYTGQTPSDFAKNGDTNK